MNTKKPCSHAWEQVGETWQCFECGAVTNLDPNCNPVLDDDFHGCPFIPKDDVKIPVGVSFVCGNLFRPVSIVFPDDTQYDLGCVTSEIVAYPTIPCWRHEVFFSAN